MLSRQGIVGATKAQIHYWVDCVQSARVIKGKGDETDGKKRKNKAVYTAAPVAGVWAGAVMGWAGAVMSWAGAVMSWARAAMSWAGAAKAVFIQKVNVEQTDRPTDRLRCPRQRRRGEEGVTNQGTESDGAQNRNNEIEAEGKVKDFELVTKELAKAVTKAMTKAMTMPMKKKEANTVSRAVANSMANSVVNSVATSVVNSVAN